MPSGPLPRGLSLVEMKLLLPSKLLVTFITQITIQNTCPTKSDKTVKKLKVMKNHDTLKKLKI